MRDAHEHTTSRRTCLDVASVDFEPQRFVLVLVEFAKHGFRSCKWQTQRSVPVMASQKCACGEEVVTIGVCFESPHCSISAEHEAVGSESWISSWFCHFSFPCSALRKVFFRAHNQRRTAQRCHFFGILLPLALQILTIPSPYKEEDANDEEDEEDRSDGAPRCAVTALEGGHDCAVVWGEKFNEKSIEEDR